MSNSRIRAAGAVLCFLAVACGPTAPWLYIIWFMACCGAFGTGLALLIAPEIINGYDQGAQDKRVPPEPPAL